MRPSQMSHATTSGNYSEPYESSPVQRSRDVSSLIEKKLESIESYFQNFEDRIARLEAGPRESRLGSSGLKAGQEIQELRAEFSRRLNILEQRVMDAPDKNSAVERIERAMNEQRSTIDFLQGKIGQLESSSTVDQRKSKLTAEIIEGVKQSFSSELRALSNAVQKVQEGQKRLESELEALKCGSSTHPIEASRLEVRATSSKHQMQSPPKRRYEQTTTESSEDDAFTRVGRDIEHPQASPYSPIRRKSQPNRYNNIKEELALKTQETPYKKEIDHRISFDEAAHGSFLKKKYETPVAAGSTFTYQASPARRYDQELRKDSSAKALSTILDGGSSDQKPRYRNVDNILAEGRQDRDRSPNSAVPSEDLSRISYVGSRSLMDTELIGLRKSSASVVPERREYAGEASSSVTAWNGGDTGARKEQLGLSEVTIQKNKDKIREDIENLKKLVKREKEKRSSTAERIRPSVSRTPEYEPRLIKLQSAMTTTTDETFGPGAAPEDDYKREGPKAAIREPMEQNTYCNSHHEDYRRQRGDNHLKVSSILEEKAVTRSVSVFEGRPEASEAKPIRRDSALHENKKKQIDLEIEKRIKEEGERRKRDSLAKALSSQSPADNTEAIDDRHFADRADMRASLRADKRRTFNYVN